MSWVLIRTSTVSDEVKHLPRPKIVQTVIQIGTREECIDKLEEICQQPENIGTDDIEVTLRVTKYTGQKSYNSQEIRKDNGKRYTDR